MTTPKSQQKETMQPPATMSSSDDVKDALDFARYGFDAITTLAEETTLEITEVSYIALESFGVWPVVLWPIHKVQRGTTRLIFWGVRTGGHVVTGVADISVRILR